MKQLFNFRLLMALLLGAGILAVASTLLPEDGPENDDFEEEHPYGEPDNAITEGDVFSFVD